MTIFHYHVHFSFGLSNDPVTDARIQAESPEQACQAIRQSAGGDITITNVKLLDDANGIDTPAIDNKTKDTVDPNQPKHLH